MAPRGTLKGGTVTGSVVYKVLLLLITSMKSHNRLMKALLTGSQEGGEVANPKVTESAQLKILVGLQLRAL